MVEFDAKVKKWGKHMGIELPKEIVKAHNIKENQSVKVLVPPRGDMMELWGMLGPLTQKERTNMTKDFMKMREEDRKLEKERMDRFISLTPGRRSSSSKAAPR